MTAHFIEDMIKLKSAGANAEPGAGVKPELFKLRAQLLDQGRSNTYLAKTDNMWATLKVYASGGENGLHAHSNEDHMFLVLQGRARFFGPNGEEQERGKNEGIMLPAGSFYHFLSCADEPLVLLRVGCRAGEGNASDRVKLDGSPMHSDSKENGREEMIPRPDAYFE